MRVRPPRTPQRWPRGRRARAWIRHRAPPRFVTSVSRFEAGMWSWRPRLFVNVSRDEGQGGEGQYLAGDIARARGQHREAATRYEAAASALTGDREAQAALRAATSRARSGSLTPALDLLRRYRLAEPGSPLEERALALKVQWSVRSGDLAGARAAFSTYERRFPSSASRSRLAALPRGGDCELAVSLTVG